MTHRIRQFLVALLFAVILAAYLTLFTPLTLYLGNSDEFTSSYLALLPTLLAFLCVLALPLAVLGALLSQRACATYIVVLAVLGLLVWVQGNFLLWEYGALDGRLIDFSQGPWRGLVDSAIWVTGIVVAIRLSDSSRRVLRNVAIAMFALQLTIGAVNGLRSNTLATAQPAEPIDASQAAIYGFSKQQNVLLLVLDGFQSDIFEEIISDPQQGPAMAASLSGFTFFRNHVGAFPYTHMSMPAALSGQIYRNHVPVRTFRDATFGDRSLLRVAMQQGYELDIAAMGELGVWYRSGGYSNNFDVPNNLHASAAQSVLDEAARLFDLSLLRSAPHFLKGWFYNRQEWRVAPLVSDSRTSQITFFSHRYFLQQWQEQMTTEREAPVFKLVHLMLSHNPMVMTEECGYAGEYLYPERPNVLNQARCSLLETAKVLDAMKLAGVYDDALIVIMGDHGAWVRPKGLKVPTNPDGSRKPMLMSGSLHGLSMPLLAVKPPGSQGALQVSSAPSWIADVPDTVATILDLDANFGRRNVFELQSDAQRERRFHDYAYDSGELDAEYLQPIQEYILDGDVYDVASWRLGERFEPANEDD